jgi:ribosomal peptide maturation radical SAM protein 1
MVTAASDREDVALVTMPFGDLHTPCLAISLLHAELKEAGITGAVHYLNIGFAERIGVERYDRYTGNQDSAFLGEWMFSDCLFPRPAADGERFVEEVLIPQGRLTLDEIERFELDRALAGPYLDECLRTVDWSRYRIVGFTTTFEQNTASLALARMIKQRHPDIVILFGGANCEDQMGPQLMRSFPWIDFVCTAEGDDVVPELVRQILGRKPRAPLAGIVGRDREPAPTRTVLDLDRLPIPDFSAYFDRLERSSLREVRNSIPLETSRGCWWGEKHHCTFCGLNGLTMRYRSKSSDRALAEIREVVERYGPRVRPTCTISFNDNILDLKYLTTLLPALRDAGLGVSLFYETKANLTKAQVRMLAESGVREIQPGIESLHTELLRLMRKGCTGLQNLQLLKWCRELGVNPSWNLLFGFPGEEPRWFEQQADTIRRVSHFQPPRGVTPVQLDRFSPYFADAALHGISRIRPARPLSYIYALPADDLARIAYHFDFDFADGRNPKAYMGSVFEAVDQWRQLERRAFCFAIRHQDRLVLWDERGESPGRLHVLPGDRGRLYEFCDRIRGRAEFIARARDQEGLAEGDAGLLLDEWIDAGLVIEESGAVLALAVLAGEAVAAGPGAITAGGNSASHARNGSRLAPTCCPRRRDSARTADLGDQLLVLDRDRGRVLILESLAGRIWSRCDGTRSVKALGDEMAGLVSGRRDAARREVARVIQVLEDEGLVDSREAVTG